MKKVIIILVFMLLLSLGLAAQTYSIEGIIRGPYWQEAIITLSGDASEVAVIYVGGIYKFRNLTAGGNYTITFSGFRNIPSIKPINPHDNIGANNYTDIQFLVNPVPLDINCTPSRVYNYTNLSANQTNQDFLLDITAYQPIYSVDVMIDNDDTHIFPAEPMEGFDSYYTFNWDTTIYEDGLHLLKFSATDTGGATWFKENKVCVNNTGVIGDINIDGEADIVDSLLIAQTYVGWLMPGMDYVMVDVNLDNRCDIVDALLIAQYYVDIITELPPAKPGGYSQAALQEPQIIAAYDFLKSSLEISHPQLMLKNIKIAYKQVVNGTNIRLTCIYNNRTEEGGLSGDDTLVAVVFIDNTGVLQKVSELTLYVPSI